MCPPRPATRGCRPSEPAPRQSVPRQPVHPAGVARRDQSRHPLRVRQRPGPLRDPPAEHPPQRLAEQPRAHHVQFGQPVRAAGEQQLAEGRQLQDLREYGRRAGPGAHQGGPEIGVHVREDGRQVARRCGGTDSRAAAPDRCRAPRWPARTRRGSVCGIAGARVQLQRAAPTRRRSTADVAASTGSVQRPAHLPPGQPAPRRAPHLAGSRRFGGQGERCAHARDGGEGDGARGGGVHGLGEIGEERVDGAGGVGDLFGE